MNTYCRFCAEPKNSDKLLNLAEDHDKLNKTLAKLTFLNATYVDVSDLDNLLPKTVCLICYDSLNNAYKFLLQVKKSQDVLTNLFSHKNEVNKDLSDDELLCHLNDFDADNNEENATNLKNELSDVINYHEDSHMSIKLEFKQEITDAETLLQEASNEDRQPVDNCNSNVNVQEILDAAIHANNFPSNVTIYAKELTNISKKSIKSWLKYSWICAYCNIEFLNVDTLRTHSKVVHGKCSAFVCIDCKKFNSTSFDGNDDFNLFVDHVRKHRKSLRNRCHYCDVIVDKSANLKKHVKQHFQKAQVPCQHCGEILNNEDSLQKHLSENQGVKPKRKPRRKRGAPITIEELTCKLCLKVYKNPNSLRDHTKLHTDDRKRNYTCERCGKMFFNKGTLTSHIMSHDKVRPHHCRICDRSFLFPNMLRRHVLMHSNVKPFSCEQCGRCFRLQYQLNAHKIIHTDAMPFVCQFCNKAFRFKQILKNHELQHTGAKPYSCQHCGMEFTNWSNYNKHMKRRHNMDTSKKKITPDGVFPVNPETGQIIQVEDPEGTEEWKTKIMVPGKRGKKKIKDLNIDLINL